MDDGTYVRRRHWSAEEKRAVVTEALSTGNVIATAKRHGSKHPAWAAAGLFCRAAVDFDEIAEAFDSELGEGHGSVRVLRIVDPDQRKHPA